MLIGMLCDARYIGVSLSPNTGGSMEHTKLTDARLSAIEAVLLKLAARDNEVLNDIRIMLRSEHSISVRNAAKADPGGFPATVLTQSAQPRDREAEQARVHAYALLCRKFGAL
jgi:hypothetical protein